MKNEKHLATKILFSSPIETIWRAYKVTYGNHFDDADNEKNMTDFIIKWVNKGHVSPLKHSLLQVACHSPIFIARQLAKHQIGMEWNEISRRYTNKGIDVHCPDGGNFEELISLCIKTYDKAIEDGLPLEQARAILPQGAITQWLWTGSFMAWANMVWQREAKHSQIDVQQFACCFLSELKSHNANMYTIIRACADVIRLK